jgi:DNA (cytosine-5)-methyltransferase 1
VLNSKNFGVPQNRERVFIIGHLGGISGQQIFPIRENDTILDGSNKWAEPETKHTFSTIATNTKRKESNYIKQINNPIHSNDRVYTDDGISPSLNTMQGGNRQPKIQEIKLEQIGIYKKEITKRANNTPIEINKFLKNNKKDLTLKK